MARINIEDSLYKEQPFIDLVIALGSVEIALGALVRAWTIAQRYWVPDRKRIPREVWDREKLRQAIIDSGMADENEDGVYIRGSEDQFKWLFQRSEAGKKPKKPRKPKKPKAPRQEESESVDKRSLSTDDRELASDDRVETSSSFSYSSSTSDSVSNSEEGEPPPPPSKSKKLPELVVLWNELAAPELPRVVSMSKGSKRHSAAVARWEECSDPSYWQQVIERMNRSDFLRGMKPGSDGRCFKADIDFFTRPDAHAKVLEGKYDNDRFGPAVPIRKNNPVQKVIDAVGKFPSGAYTTGAEWTVIASRIKEHVGEDAWKLIRAVGGWQKVNEMAATPGALRAALRDAEKQTELFLEADGKAKAV